MKKVLLVLGLFSLTALQAQDCSELFISEYLEATSNNKALEIYNPTDQTIDLSNYFVVRYNNGNSAATKQNCVQLTGMLAPHDVHVGVLDKRDTSGTGQEAPVWDILQAKADAFYSPDYDISNTFYWNGNDAVVLMKGKIPADLPLGAAVSSFPNLSVLDIIGKIGEDPGAEGWSYSGNPIQPGEVGATKDHDMIRKPNVVKGRIDPGTFVPATEWDTIPLFSYVFDENGDTVMNSNNQPKQKFNIDSLGSHTCACGNATATQEISMPTFGFRIFPNPVDNNQLNFITTDQVKRIIILNSLGQRVKEIVDPKQLMTIHLEVNPGLYFISAYGENNLKVTKKFIVK